VNATRVKVAEV